MRRILVLLFMGLLATTALSATGCRARAPVMELNGIKVYAHMWDRAVDQLAPQASHELRCAPEDLRFALFKKRGRHPTQIGVDGCGQRVLYARTRGRRGTWRMVAVHDPGVEMVPVEPLAPAPRQPPQPPLPPAAHYPG